MYYRAWNYTVLPDEKNKVKNPFDMTVRSLPRDSVWSVLVTEKQVVFWRLRINKELM